MTYYIARISDTQSDIEHIATVLLDVNPDKIDEQLNIICATWYSEDEPVAGDEDGYFYHINGNMVFADGYQQISKETFAELKQFIPAY